MKVWSNGILSPLMHSFQYSVQSLRMDPLSVFCSSLSSSVEHAACQSILIYWGNALQPSSQHFFPYSFKPRKESLRQIHKEWCVLRVSKLKCYLQLVAAGRGKSVFFSVVTLDVSTGMDPHSKGVIQHP